MIGGIPITKKQRYLAGRSDLVALLRSRGETLKRLGSEWEWKFHDERVTIRNNVWFDQYTQKGGDAVDFFRYFYGESEEQAAAMLLNCSVADLEKLPARSPPQGTPFKEREEKIMEVPPAYGNMRRVFAYLCQTRGIAPEVVSAFARKGMIYEDADHHNAVFVGRDIIGSGDRELGANLMRMFFYTLAEGDALPESVLFMNDGVKLPTLDDQVAAHVQTLTDRGVEVLVCGTCLSFYGLTDRLQAGTVSNMFDIVSRMQAAAKVITL